LIEVFETHKPFFDNDRDLFATGFGLRGSAWRGKDCEDKNKNFYPGRKNPPLGSELDDFNCNGIRGKAPNGKSYKEVLCNVQQRGIAIIGDSATAHFRIPETYFNVTNITMSTYQHLFGLLEREIDWPHLSWSTGHMKDNTGDNLGNVDSIYLRLRNRNRCNHRDFQNIGINGARSGSLSSKLVQTLSRNPMDDHPLITFWAPIGNDICTPRPEGRGTEPSQFYNNTINGLNYLERILPNNSYVVFIGLVDGRILYNTLSEEMHPLGAKYKDVYSHLSCLRINPCWLWLNTNQTWREYGSKRAQELNDQYKKKLLKKELLQNLKCNIKNFLFKKCFKKQRTKEYQ